MASMFYKKCWLFFLVPLVSFSCFNGFRLCLESGCVLLGFVCGFVCHCSVEVF